MFHVRYTERALKDLSDIPLSWRRRIMKAADGLPNHPFRGKKLEGKLEGVYSIRVWPYRILYQILKKEIVIYILHVGHRQGVYR